MRLARLSRGLPGTVGYVFGFGVDWTFWNWGRVFGLKWMRDTERGGRGGGVVCAWWLRGRPTLMMMMLGANRRSASFREFAYRILTGHFTSTSLQLIIRPLDSWVPLHLTCSSCS